jgi:NADH:ubiquinone oxidoreductase subunit
MKKFLLQFFTWWNGATMGTSFYTWLRGEFVGEDEFGNRYYRAKASSPYEERRWVIYKGEAEPSQIPPGWHGWMHHKVDTPPTGTTYVPRPWQKPHIANPTGTPQAYRPAGSVLSPTPNINTKGDYEAWTPDP